MTKFYKISLLIAKTAYISTLLLLLRSELDENVLQSRLAERGFEVDARARLRRFDGLEQVSELGARVRHFEAQQVALALRQLRLREAALRAAAAAKRENNVHGTLLFGPPFTNDSER